LADLLYLIRKTPDLDWLLLSKRPQNWGKRIAHSIAYCITKNRSELGTWISDWQMFGNPPENCWLGTSVEDQIRADERIPALLEIPAKIRFLSCEPLLQNVDLKFPPGANGPAKFPTEMEQWSEKRRDEWFIAQATATYVSQTQLVDWVICGGESGPGARPFTLRWARSLKDQCEQFGIPFFMKQTGKVAYDQSAEPLKFKSKKGNDPDEWPEDLRVRQFPESHPIESRP